MRKIGAVVCTAALAFGIAAASAQTSPPSVPEAKGQVSGEQERPQENRDEPESTSHDAEKPNTKDSPAAAATTGESTDKEPVEKK